MIRRRARRQRVESRPWTAEEDDKLREINEIGLIAEYWRYALPDRTHHEICERRLDLGIRPAKPI